MVYKGIAFKSFTIVCICALLVLAAGCVTQPIPIFVTGKLRTADGTYIAIVNDTAYQVTTEDVYNKLIINQTNYVNFDANSIGLPGGTRISGVHPT